MNILFDHQIFTMQRFGGISKYHIALQRELRLLGVCANILSPISDNYYIDNSLNKTFHLPLKQHLFNKAAFCVNNIITKLNVANFNGGIFHPTYYDPYFFKFKMPIVLTVHDLIHELYFPRTPVVKSFLEKKKKAIMRADKIIAISENTKNDLLQFYEIGDPSKIKVVYHGVDHSSLFNEEKDESSFLLFVGERSGYKNFNFMLQAIAPLLKKYQLNLICCGKPFSKDELSLINGLNLNDIVTVERPSDKNLDILYRKALLFIYPSIYEGFGMPILEAFANRCPVCLSNASSFPEVAQDGASYFDPNDKDSIYSVLESVIESSEARRNMIIRGTKIVQNFTWRNTAIETLEVYDYLK